MYRLEISELLRGDIILIRTNDSTCRRIRELSKSNYSHALIYRGDKCLLESNAFGVQASNPQRLVLENIDDALVLRLEDKSLIHQLETGFSNAAEKVGMSYSLKEVIRSHCENLENARESKRQFCTRFIAQLYEESGIDIVKNPDYCSPKEIEESKKLEPVDNCVRLATDMELELTSDENNSINKQTEAIFDFFDRARKLSGLDIQTFNDVGEFLISSPDFDKKFNDLLVDSGYLDLGDFEMSKNEEFYDQEKFIRKFGIANGILISYGEIDNEMIRVGNFKNAMYKYGSLFQRHSLSYFRSQRDCYLRQLELSMQRMNVFMQCLDSINEA